MSNTNTDTSKPYKSRFVLHIKDINDVDYDTRTDGNSKEQPRKLQEGTAKRMWLSLATLGPLPESQNIHFEEKFGDGQYFITFDPDKEGRVSELIQTDPTGMDEDKNLKAARTEDEMELIPKVLKPGLRKYKVIGEFNIKFKDSQKNTLGPGKINVDLSFWLDVEKNVANMQKSVEFEEEKQRNKPPYFVRDADGKLHAA